MRTFPTNTFFNTMEAEGTLRLRRVLQAVAWTIPSVGYCQGMGMVAGVLLMVMEEDEAFWTMRALLTKKLPKDYYSPTLLGVMVHEASFYVLNVFPLRIYLKRIAILRFAFAFPSSI